MSALDRDKLKEMFRNGEKPDEVAFAHLIDSFVNQDSDDFTITSDGKVGLGNSSPEARLHINGELQLKDSEKVVAFSSGANFTTNGEETVVPTQKAVADYVSAFVQQFLANDIKAFVDQTLAGSVSAFAMETPPDGWLLCDGRAMSRTDYVLLFQRIGTRFGTGDGSTTFNLPDLRGRFLRGWANGSSADPNKDQREAAYPTGPAGDQVGTLQQDALQTHEHDFAGITATTDFTDPAHKHDYSKTGINTPDQIFETKEFTGFEVGLEGAATTEANINHTHNFTPQGTISEPTSARLATETRPANIAVMYCIKY